MQQYLKDQLRFCGIDEYHSKGYKGKGIKIFNHELDWPDEHGGMTTDVLRLVAPEATIINARLISGVRDSVWYYYFRMPDGEGLSFMEMYEKFKPDIMSVSWARENLKMIEAMRPLVEAGMILFNAAGNDGSAGVNSRYGKELPVTVGAAGYFDGKPRMMGYSSYDKGAMEVDLAGFMGAGSGTSAGCPFVAAQCALIFQKYGKMTKEEFLTFCNEKTYDVYNNGDDEKSGKGILIMPNEKVTNFDDVPIDRWDAEFIEWARAQGLMNGVSDKLFDPDGHLTRGQMAAILYRLENREV